MNAIASVIEAEEKPDLLPGVRSTEVPMTADEGSTIKIVHFELTRMVPLDLVHSFAWNEERGRRLKALRGSIALADLAKMIDERGVKCGKSNLSKLETGLSQTITQKLLKAICETLDSDFSYFFPTAQIGLDNPIPPP